MPSPDDTSPPEYEGEVPPSHAIIEAIAAREGVDTTDIEPPEYESLYTVVNPEALDDLFRTDPPLPERNGYVEFRYEGYVVTVYSDGQVELHESTAADESTVDE